MHINLPALPVPLSHGPGLHTPCTPLELRGAGVPLQAEAQPRLAQGKQGGGGGSALPHELFCQRGEARAMLSAALL